MNGSEKEKRGFLSDAKSKGTFLLLTAGFLTIGFGIRLAADYCNAYPFGSAPFYVYVLERGIEFLLPAILLCIFGLRLHRKHRQDD